MGWIERIKNYNDTLQGDYPFLKSEVLGTPVSKWLVVLIVLIAVYLVLRTIELLVLKSIERLALRRGSRTMMIVADAIRAVKWPSYFFLSSFVALAFLGNHPALRKWALVLFLLSTVYYLVQVLFVFVDYGTRKIAEKGREHSGRVHFLGVLLKIIIWLAAIFIILANAGVSIGPLLAVLGIGGLALGLALQQIAADMVAAFTLFFDKPFNLGDRIDVGGFQGTVIKMGLRSIRIRAETGEELIVPNKEAASAKIRNYSVRP